MTIWQGFTPRFIVSTGRTGTKFLVYLLNNLFNDIDVRHEPEINFLKLRYRFEVGKISLENATQEFLKLRYNLYNNVQEATYIESNPYLSTLIPIIKKIFSDYRIIHIVRDGREWLRSAMSRGIQESFVFKTSLPLVDVLRMIPINTDWYRKLNLLRINNIMKDIWRIRAIDFKDDPYRDLWNHMSQLERFAWKWQKINRFIQEAIKDDNKAMIIHFEDLFKQNYSGIQKILDFFELDYSLDLKRSKLDSLLSEKINKTRSFRLSHWKNWEPEQMHKFNLIAGDLMRYYGYY
ncbi:MAG: sulfotransferase domain-containing protein [Candidatus Thorarchaeota archaeon]